MIIDFDEEFAGILDYADAYRSLGLQVVPAIYPTKNAINWKRPALSNWREYQNDLVSEHQFKDFFKGHDVNRLNIGILTGACSSRVFVVDLDLHKGGDCAVWWNCCLDMQQTAGELETPTQVTGGGGLQMLFRAPEDWTPPTIKTSIGVDIRGAGGFAVIAPSMHESGKRYHWEEGLEPWTIPIADAPHWLCEQIDELAKQYGGHSSSAAGGVKTATPDHMSDGYGHLIDGREDYMSKMIWARVVDLYRDSPIMDKALSLRERDALFDIYLMKVDTRLTEPGDKAELLEKEGRGRTLFNQKWAAAMKQWDGKVANHAQEVREKPSEFEKNFNEQLERVQAEIAEQFAETDQKPEKKEKTSSPIRVLNMTEIMALPDPVWLVDDMFVEDATAFIYGPPGCGKSFIALDLGMSLASDKIDSWMGRKINRHGPVVYITNEGVASLKFRLRSIESKYGIAHAETPFFLIPDPINFLNAKQMLDLLQAIKHDVEQAVGAPPVAFFIDTVSRVIPGADENLQKDMTPFIASIAMVKHTFNCMAVGVHHQAKAGGTDMRGSGVLTGAGDTNIQVEREKGDDFGQMHARKIKDAEDGWTIDFELRKVELGFGKTSLIVEKVDPATLVAKTSKDAPAGSAGSFGGYQETGVDPSIEVCRQIVDFIDQEARDGIPLSKDKQTRTAGRYAPDVICRRFPVTPEWIERIMALWLENGVVKYEIVDAKTKKKGLMKARGL